MRANCISAGDTPAQMCVFCVLRVRIWVGGIASYLFRLVDCMRYASCGEKTDPFVGERVDWHLVLFSFEYVSMSRHLSSRWELHSISLHTVNCIMQNGLNKFTVNDHIVCIQLDLHCRIVVIVAIIHTILN